MKKIYLSLMLFGAVALASCDMDKAPYGSLDDETGIESAQDVREFRNQLYSSLRGVTSGSWLYTSDLQMDEFHGVISNGNNMGDISNATFNISTSYFESFWSGAYSVIATANAVLAQCDNKIADPSFSDADKQNFERYKGEAKFTRAYMYFWLADHYCLPYTRTDVNKAASGLPLTTTYNPTSDVKAYPSRSTLAETFNLIDQDLKDAYDALKKFEANGTYNNKEKANPEAYISSWAVEALQARVALIKGDWATARDKSTDVISNGGYELANISNYESMWTTDDTKEVHEAIFQPIMTSTELGGSNGTHYISADQTTANYIPTYGTLAMYDDTDVRMGVFFTLYTNLQVEGSSYQVFVMNKFPGNPALWTGSVNNIMNMSKPFRLSEMYLIAAESYGQLNDLGNASNYLNEFISNRVDGYVSTQFISQSTLLNRVYDEREKEFLGEGMRMSDLRRLGKGFIRYASHDEDPTVDGIVVATGRSLSYSVDDYRYTWPIPKAEMDSNPQLKGQQNPGY